MRIIARSTLKEFWVKHANSEQQLKAWYHDAKNSNWKSPTDINKLYPSASFLSDNRVVFNIKGNHYRLIVKINYDFQIMYIRFIGTHKEYDKIDALKI
ncbi:MAG: type II toxin-antitoxin system HigB family toxin [Cytophagales bacterium]